MGGAGSALIVFGVLVLIGAPIALSIPGTRPEWTELAFESAVIGLVVEMFVAIVLLHAGYYNAGHRVALHVVIVGGAAFALRRAGARERCAAADLSQLRAARSRRSIGIATLALIVVALWIRKSPSYFIFQTGDMGGYVNSANILRHADAPFGVQPHGFTLFLRETNLLLGRANTVAGLPALGAILVLGAIAFARRLGVHVAPRPGHRVPARGAPRHGVVLAVPRVGGAVRHAADRAAVLRGARATGRRTRTR